MKYGLVFIFLSVFFIGCFKNDTKNLNQNKPIKETVACRITTDKTEYIQGEEVKFILSCACREKSECLFPLSFIESFNAMASYEFRDQGSKIYHFIECPMRSYAGYLETFVPTGYINLSNNYENILKTFFLGTLCYRLVDNERLNQFKNKIKSKSRLVAPGEKEWDQCLEEFPVGEYTIHWRDPKEVFGYNVFRSVEIPVKQAKFIVKENVTKKDFFSELDLNALNAKLYIKDGINRFFDERGQLLQELDYLGGQKHGKSKIYYSNGKVQSEGLFNNGRLESTKDFYETGELKPKANVSKL